MWDRHWIFIFIHFAFHKEIRFVDLLYPEAPLKLLLLAMWQARVLNVDLHWSAQELQCWLAVLHNRCYLWSSGNTLHQNNLQDSHCLESMLVFWFFMKDTPLWTKTQWVIWTLTEGRWKMGRMEHPQRRAFITVSQPVVHCSCPSFLLLIVTLVFWPSTPKPAAWVIPDFLWHSSELSRGLD